MLKIVLSGWLHYQAFSRIWSQSLPPLKAPGTFVAPKYHLVSIPGLTQDRLTILKRGQEGTLIFSLYPHNLTTHTFSIGKRESAVLMLASLSYMHLLCRLWASSTLARLLYGSQVAKRISTLSPLRNYPSFITDLRQESAA